MADFEVQWCMSCVNLYSGWQCSDTTRAVYNSVGVVPGWPLHACATHGDVAGPQAVTQLRGHTQHADSWRVGLGNRPHVDVRLHQSTEVIQCVEGSQQLWGEGEGRRGSDWIANKITTIEYHRSDHLTKSARLLLSVKVVEENITCFHSV